MANPGRLYWTLAVDGYEVGKAFGGWVTEGPPNPDVWNTSALGIQSMLHPGETPEKRNGGGGNKRRRAADDHPRHPHAPADMRYDVSYPATEPSLFARIKQYETVRRESAQKTLGVLEQLERSYAEMVQEVKRLRAQTSSSRDVAHPQRSEFTAPYTQDIADY